MQRLGGLPIALEEPPSHVRATPERRASSAQAALVLAWTCDFMAPPHHGPREAYNYMLSAVVLSVFSKWFQEMSP